MPRAYIETTIPSYYVARTSLNLLQASRQASTRLWWDKTNPSNTMKTTDPSILDADPVITELRRVKTALAAKHNFDVLAMVRALQERERRQKCEQEEDGKASAAIS